MPSDSPLIVLFNSKNDNRVKGWDGDGKGGGGGGGV